MESLLRGNRYQLLSALLLVASGSVFFVLKEPFWGLGLIGASLTLASVISRSFFHEICIIAIGLLVMAAVPVTTDISYSHMMIMGFAMLAAVLVPYTVSRYIYHERVITFPWHFRRSWSKTQWIYLATVPLVAYLVLPFYMITSGVYQNWPAVSGGDEVLRLFIGTNVLGIWDELFFICVVFVVLRRHVGFWMANILQAVLFTSFLYELGFESWGPLMIYPFALLQGWIFTKTHSLFYIVCIHLIFDFFLFLVLLHAHNRQLFDIFLFV